MASNSPRVAPEIIRPRITLGTDAVIGPGKIDLLRAIVQHGSISAAARANGMGYKRAWSLLDELNRACGAPAVSASVGGSGGGGAEVTALGQALIQRYDAIEAACREASIPHLKGLQRLFKR